MKRIIFFDYLLYITTFLLHNQIAVYGLANQITSQIQKRLLCGVPLKCKINKP